jgi:hypothetical protein
MALKTPLYNPKVTSNEMMEPITGDIETAI